MKKDIKNIRASIRAKLQNKAKETNCPFAEVLQYFGIERFLYRFSCSEYANKFILKGALIFIVWHVPEGKKLFAKEIYNEKSDRQILWKAFLKKGDIKYVPEKLSSVAKEIEKFLYKPINAINKSEKFDARWKASGPWGCKN